MKRVDIVIDGSAPLWAQRLQTDLNRALDEIARRIGVRTIPKAGLPTDGSETIALVPDEAGGSVLAFFDNAAWRRVTDRAVVS